MRILVVEDEELIAEALQRYLMRSGHSVDHQKDGLTALQTILSSDYDVIILDVVLPNIHGYEICRRVRAHGIATPILMLSSLDAESSRVRGLNVGADDYLVKPFSYKELEARLKALYRRPNMLNVRSEIVRHLEVDMSHKRVTKDNIEVVLRNKEYLLLVYLMRHRGTAVSREELLLSIWGIAPENSSNRVDACVKSLRSKIGKSYITTVPKVGYRLE